MKVLHSYLKLPSSTHCGHFAAPDLFFKELVETKPEQKKSLNTVLDLDSSGGQKRDMNQLSYEVIACQHSHCQQNRSINAALSGGAQLI